MDLQSALRAVQPNTQSEVSPATKKEIAESYWNKYYIEASEIQQRTGPSDFCRHCVSSVFRSQNRCVVDLGCGNGRDSVYLAQHGYSVIAIDQSRAALALVRNLAMHKNVGVKIEQGNFSHFLSPVPTNAYSRFSLHAIDSEAQKALFHNVRRMVCSDHVFAIEARTTQDVNPNAAFHEERWEEDHYRRYLHVPTLIEELVTAGFEIQSVTQGRDFAPLPGVENPHIVRITAI